VGSLSRRVTVLARLAQTPDPNRNITKSKKGWGCDTSGRHLPSNHKALSSNPSTAPVPIKKQTILYRRKMNIKGSDMHEYQTFTNFLAVLAVLLEPHP
jgi:hypothetical protein